MSTVRRLVSAGAASWVRIFVTIFSQVLLVPVYLRHWDVETYGAWLLIQSLISFMTIVDVAHQHFIGYEFLRLGRRNMSDLADMFCSAAPVALIASLISFAGLAIVLSTGVLGEGLGISPDLMQPFILATLVMAATWVVAGSVLGVVVRVLYPFDCYPLLAWFGSAFALVTALAPALAVSVGADLIGAAFALSATTIIYSVVQMLVLLPLIRAEKLFSGRIDFVMGFRRFGKSMALAAQTGLELLRQHGVRVILLPLAGMTELATFATIRTGANFAQQGLNTITGPLMPELMRFLRERDQARTESAFGTVWLVLCTILSPMVIVAQWIMPAIYPLWTQGKLRYDPWLFGVLSISILVFALAQPAMAIMRGNNLLRVQLWISLMAAFICVAGMAVLVPITGIRGAGVALLLAECACMVAYVWQAKNWLSSQGLSWPFRAFWAVALSVIVTAGGVALLAALPQDKAVLIMISILAVQAFTALFYWTHLPDIARQRARQLAVRAIPRRLKG